MVTPTRIESDSLPEYIKYRDVGCDLHSHCLTCPLVVCKEELTLGSRAVRAHMRGLQITLLKSEGRTAEWIAQVLGISVRGVYKSMSLARNSELSSLTDRATSSKMSVAVIAAPSNGRRHDDRQTRHP